MKRLHSEVCPSRDNEQSLRGESRIEPFPGSQTAILNQLLCSLTSCDPSVITKQFIYNRWRPYDCRMCNMWVSIPRNPSCPEVHHMVEAYFALDVMLHSKPVVFNSHVCGWELFNVQISGSQWLQFKGKRTAFEFVTQII